VGATRAWIAEAEATFAAVAEAPDAERIPTLADGICDRVDDIIAAEGQPGDAITTGIADLDRLMGPTAPGAFVIVGAHSGVGKTSLAMQMASHVASCCTIDGQAAGALVISQEMMLAELADRAICGALDMDTRTISSGRLGATGMTRITGAAEVVRTRPSALRNIWVDDRPSVSPEQLRVRARQVMREAKDRGVRLAVIFVDYLQLCDGSDGGKRSFERAEREFSYISKELKKLAKRLRVVIVALAQLNEDAREEQRYPRGEDFSQCKALRHDADRVLLIHNETALARRVAEVDDRDQPGDLPPEVAQIIVDKNRGGREGLIHCLFSPSRSSFYDMAIDDRRAYVANRKREREAQRAAGRGRRGGGR
jgi:replicative DNA helicase